MDATLLRNILVTPIVLLLRVPLLGAGLALAWIADGLCWAGDRMPGWHCR